MQNPIIQAIAAKFALLSPLLDERARRLWAAVEARTIGRGGISQVAEATRLSRATIRAGLQELAQPVSPSAAQATVERVRRPGGGRKPLGAHNPHLVRALETLLDPVTRGDPMSLLRWTCKTYCPSGVWRLLRRCKWSPQKPVRRSRERDEVAIAQWPTDVWPWLKKSPA
jgi:transposase